jgi:hypothetical protein
LELLMLKRVLMMLLELKELNWYPIELTSE